MLNTARAQANYYEQNQISWIKKPSERECLARRALYTQLGIPPLFIKGKAVLEIGPGKGAFYMLLQQPKSCIFYEPSATELEKLRDLNTSTPEFSNIEITYVPKYLDELNFNASFDLVICEGILPGRPLADALFMFDKLVQVTRPNGMIIVTCSEYMAFMADMIRKVMGNALMRNFGKNGLTAFFEKHMAGLPGMERSISAWVNDIVFNPATEDLAFSMDTVLQHVREKALFWGASPNFFTDWRWHKNIDSDCETNDYVCRQWRQNRHATVNYAARVQPACEELTDRLHALARDCFFAGKAFLKDGEHNNWDLLEQMAFKVEAFADAFATLPGDTAWTALALHDAAQALRNIKQAGFAVDCGNFSQLFGKGQLYLALMKN